MKVIKRDGSECEFCKIKIFKAICKAMKNGSGIYMPDIARIIADDAEKKFSNNREVPTIHNIESYVYDRLVHYGQSITAKAYEGYRAVQEFKRNTNTTDNNILDLINGTSEVKRDNSNKNATLLATQRDLIAGEVSKDIARRLLIPTHIVQAHDNGILHWHDMDYTVSKGMTNCCDINIEDMLDNGTVINGKMVETPKSFETACTVVTQIMAQVSSNQYGGQTFTIKHIAKYLRVTEEKTYKYNIAKGRSEELSRELAKEAKLKDLKDGIQTIRYQLSTLQTTNGQAPFSTIYLEIEVGNPYEEEMALICEEMIKQRLVGMKNYKGQEIGESFPKLVYLLDECNCLQGGKYDYITKLAAECTAKRLVPDYQSAKIMRENYEGNVFPPMGCRSHLSPWKDENGNYKWYGRFNQGVVSLNLAQIGIICKNDYKKMWNMLDHRVTLCLEALMIRHELLLGTTSDVSPIHWQHGALARLKPGEKIDKYLNSSYSTLSLGYVGLYELVYCMTGESHTSEKGEKLALEVMKYLRRRCDEKKKETGLGFSLYGTPAEKLVYSFCKIDTAKFGIIENVTDKGYYTNSYHVDVREKIDAFSKLKFESQFHSISSGGCISYIEVPDLSKNLQAVEELIKFIYNNVQYAEINSKPDVCYVCGFRGEIKLNKGTLKWYCPCCGNTDENEMQVMRRTCGYIGTTFWNKGRTKEIGDRVIHL